MHEFQSKKVGKWGTRPPCRKKWGDAVPPRPRPTTHLVRSFGSETKIETELFRPVPRPRPMIFRPREIGRERTFGVQVRVETEIIRTFRPSGNSSSSSRLVDVVVCQRQTEQIVESVEGAVVEELDSVSAQTQYSQVVDVHKCLAMQRLSHHIHNTTRLWQKFVFFGLGGG